MTSEDWRNNDLSREGWEYIGHASALERLINSDLDRLPHGEAKRLITDLSAAAAFLRGKAEAFRIKE